MLKITVLLSSYNGEKFIKEQLDSILEQDVQDIAELKILVRDDGSKDGTHEILNEYKNKGLLSWYTGENLRPARSFWHLMNNCDDSDFYAFCDQDDVWKKDKLSRAIKLLREKKQDTPLLYCSSVTIVDAELKKIGELDCQNRTSDDFAQSLIYSIAPGCTFVFNNSARAELSKYDIEKNYTLIHDWLAHKIIAMKGEIIFDNYQSLENERIELERSGDILSIIGVDDPSFQTGYLTGDSAAVMTSELQKLTADHEGYTILLSHRPELYDIYTASGIDLIFSGHAHGGQFRLPIVGGLIAPNQGWLPEYDSGLYTQGNTNMLVSRGIGNSIIPIRFNNRPEIIVVELLAE